jgi:hypothetical protein
VLDLKALKEHREYKESKAFRDRQVSKAVKVLKEHKEYKEL